MQSLVVVILATGIFFLGAARGQSVCGTGTGPEITVTNLQQNEAVGYELLLVKGAVISNVDKVTVSLDAPLVNLNDASPYIEPRTREWPAGGGAFKALLRLTKGRNRIYITAPGHRVRCLDINYSPNPLPNRIRMVYLLAKDTDVGTGVFPVAPGDASDLESAKKRMGFGAMLMETAMAELLHEAGMQRRAVSFKRDATGQVEVTVFHSAFTNEELSKKTADELWDLFHDELGDALQDGRTKFMAMIGTFGGGALGGSSMAMFGTHTLYSWAQNLDELIPCFTDNRKPGDFQLEDDSGFRNSFWANYSTTIGATLHELGHALGLPNTNDSDDVMERGFDRFNRIFMVQENGSLITNQAIRYAPLSAGLLMQSPFVLAPAPVAIASKAARAELSLESDGRTLVLTLPAAGEVSLDLHRVDGTKAASVVSGRLARGRHVLDLPPVAPGIYFCVARTEAGKRTATLRIAPRLAP
jgi:hypothetical protein